MYTAVVSFHMNPYTCGIARFNFSLARTLGVEVISLNSYLSQSLSGKVLLSLKLEEVSSETLEQMSRRLPQGDCNFALLLHGTNGSALEAALCTHAVQVFAANSEIASTIAKFRANVISVFAPGAPVLPQKTPVDCTLLTFGMAHKIRSSGYRRLAAMMRSDPRKFRLEISTALHEGGVFDESFFVINDEISEAFGGNVRFLGFLADAEVSERLRDVDALVAFFPRGVRENNTTVLSAMAHGCPVVTNCDEFSPPWMAHNVTIFDVNKLDGFPVEDALRQVGSAAKEAVSEFGFDRLGVILQAPEHS
jgi:hypothetical protein